MRWRLFGTAVTAAVIGLLSPGTGSCSDGEDAGRKLAEQHCARCHQFPEPASLDARTWRRHVLPEMAARNGIFEFGGRRVDPDREAPAGVYPDVPTISLETWEMIHDYYLNNAPEKPAGPRSGRPAIVPGLGGFVLERPGSSPPGLPLTSSVFVDQASQRVVAGDAAGKRLLIYDASLNLLHAVPVASPPVDVIVRPDGAYWVTLIGSIAPVEGSGGSVVEVVVPPGGRGGAPPRVRTVLTGLKRPVQTVVADVDADGIDDALVCCFGYFSGELALFKGTGGGAFARETILPQPGVLRVLFDLPGVGDRPAFVLVAQGDERIVRIGDLAGPLRQPPTVLKRFPPSRGSSSIDSADFDGDGDMDIIYTAGDNADYSPVYKVEHGVYLFLNEGGEGGGGSFHQAFFFPMHGAYKAVPGDFDCDGDLDIAAVSFFADYSPGSGDEGFVLLENAGAAAPGSGRGTDRFTFTPRTVTGIGNRGRFIDLAAGDLDGDDDIDLVLANFAFGPTGADAPGAHRSDEWLGEARFVVLRNTAED